MEASNGVYARLGYLEKAAERLDHDKADLRDVEIIRDELRSLKHALWAFALGIPIGGLTLLASVLQLVGRH